MTEADVDQPLHGPVHDFRQLGFSQGEVVIVTGGGSGIGQATAIMAAASGLAVAVWDMNAQGAAETVEAITDKGGVARAMTVNIGDDTAVAAALDLTAAMGKCRYLVNNAAPSTVTQGSFDELMMLAVGGAYRVTMGWLDRFGSDVASAVNMSSTSGNFQGGKTQAHYPTAKGAVSAMTRHLAVKYEGRPRFNTVAPGFTITPRTLPYLKGEDFRQRTSRIPMGRAGFPEEIAAAVLFLLSPAAGYINGVLLPVDGGWILA